MHERLISSPGCPLFTKYSQRITCVIFVYLFLSFCIYHKLYVNQSDILTNAIESQLLSHAKRPEYQHLGYSESSDKFIFCNKESYSRDDTESLAKQVVK